ncbi:MAG: hypothetical protein HYZ73_00535 [Elusimicrobia bacterium]|nr:hypothetical protein [Elusimicrobiota bacterium]
MMTFTQVSQGFAQAAGWEHRTTKVARSIVQALGIPLHEGIVIDHFQGRSDQPRIIHIQDAHNQPLGQWHIARILHRLASTRNRLVVGIEGAWGPLETQWLAQFPDIPEKRRVATALLRQGELHGEEYAALTLPPPRLHSGQAGRLHLIGVDDPQLYRAHATAKAAVERQRGTVLQRLETIEHSLAHHPHPNPLPSREREKKEAGLPRPHEWDVTKEQGGSPLQRWVYLQRQLWSLTLTPADYTEYLQLQQQVTPHPHLVRGGGRSCFVAFRNHRNKAERQLRPRLADPPEEFYAIAKRRDEALAHNTLQVAQALQAQEIVLLAGGFHTPGLTQFLRSRGVSYVVIQPMLIGELPAPPGLTIEGPAEAFQRALTVPGSPAYLRCRRLRHPRGNGVPSSGASPDHILALRLPG